MTESLPEDLQRFVAEHIGSVLQLEALLLLRRTAAEWTADALAQELRIEPSPAIEQLTELCRLGLLQSSTQSPQRFWYAPRSAALDALVARVEQAYGDRRVSVISLIYSTPRPAVRVFAEAFRIRRDDNG